MGATVLCFWIAGLITPGKSTVINITDCRQPLCNYSLTFLKLHPPAAAIHALEIHHVEARNEPSAVCRVLHIASCCYTAEISKGRLPLTFPKRYRGTRGSQLGSALCPIPRLQSVLPALVCAYGRCNHSPLQRWEFSIPMVWVGGGRARGAAAHMSTSCQQLQLSKNISRGPVNNNSNNGLIRGNCDVLANVLQAVKWSSATH